MKYQPPYGVSEPDAPYINGDPSIARQGSIIPAAAVEFPQRELVNLIDSSDIIPSDNDLFQTTRAVRAQWVNFCVDTGSVNALSVALDPPLTAYKQGLPLRVVVKNDGTGAATINVNSLGNKLISRPDGSALHAGDLKAGGIALLVDDGSKFQLVNYLGAAGVANNNYNIDIPYAEDTGTPNTVIGIYSPAITIVAPGDLVLIKIANVNTGAVIFNVNSLASAPMRRTDGQPLQSNDLVVGEIMLLCYTGTYWQCMRLVRSQVMFKLTGNLILYVRSDGNDVTGDGSTNTAGKAFKTIQRAVDFVKASLYIAGRTVTIQIGIPGTYPNFIVASLPGRVVVRGDPANMTSYVVQGPVLGSINPATGLNTSAMMAQCVSVSGSGIDVTLQGLTFSMRESQSNHTQCDYGAFLTIDDCAYTGVATGGNCVATTSGQVILLNNIHVYSNVTYVLFATDNASIIVGAWYSNFYVHGISYHAFCLSNGGSSISLYNGWMNWTGSAYGYRFLCIWNSVILTYASGAQWLPGNVDGVADPSSVYM